MKTTINWKSRTVWAGFMSIAFGIASIVWPVLDVSQSPDVLISIGVLGVFFKS